jgi:hypothetical protein
MFLGSSGKPISAPSLLAQCLYNLKKHHHKTTNYDYFINIMPDYTNEIEILKTWDRTVPCLNHLCGLESPLSLELVKTLLIVENDFYLCVDALFNKRNSDGINCFGLESFLIQKFTINKDFQCYMQYAYSLFGVIHIIVYIGHSTMIEFMIKQDNKFLEISNVRCGKKQIPLLINKLGVHQEFMFVESRYEITTTMKFMYDEVVENLTKLHERLSKCGLLYATH